MSIPTNLLQSQLALNKQIITKLHGYEQYHLDEARSKEGIFSDSHYALAKDFKNSIWKYARLQVAIKATLRESAYNAKYFPVDCEDF